MSFFVCRRGHTGASGVSKEYEWPGVGVVPAAFAEESMGARKQLIPEFGPFRGMRVLGAGSLIAMPFAAGMLAEFGAEFIQIERPKVGDTYRKFAPVAQRAAGATSAAWVQEARNRLSLTLKLDMKDPDSREIFYGLIEKSDIFMENLVWLKRYGIDDQTLLERNPRLVIVHVSGYGRKEFGGLPEMCRQASYDIVGQTFSGYALFNGYPDRPPLLTAPALNDYVTALFAAFGMLAAYIEAQRTGRGQVVDISQYESQAKIMRDAFTRQTLGIGEITRSGNRSPTAQPWDIYVSRDGKYIGVGAVGDIVYCRFLGALGLSRSKYPFAAVASGREAVESERGREFAAAVEAWFSERDADEIELVMRKARVPCSRINTPADCLEHPHFQSRNDFICYTDQTLQEEIRAFGVFPKLSETPGRVWRGAPALGQDTEEILRELLGFDDEKIQCLRRRGVV